MSHSVSLEGALKNAKFVYANSFSSKAKPCYLKNDFNIAYKSKQSAKVDELVKQVMQLFNDSNNPERLTQAKDLFKVIGLITPFSEGLKAQVNEAIAVMEKNRLEQIPQELSTLVQLKEILQLFFEYMNHLGPGLEAEKFYAEEMEHIGVTADGNWRLRTKRKSTLEDLQKLIESSDGLAFATRFPSFVSECGQGKYDVSVKDLSADDIQSLKTFIRHSSPATSELANWLYRFWKSSKGRREFSASMCLARDAMFEFMKGNSSAGKFVISLLPTFEQLATTRLSVKIDATNILTPSSLHFFIKQHRQCQEIRGQLGNLHSCYQALCKEYADLRKKSGSTETEPELPTFSLPSFLQKGGSEEARPLPTSTEFASVPLELVPLDLEPFLHPSAPRKADDKPATVAEPKPSGGSESSPKMDVSQMSLGASDFPDWEKGDGKSSHSDGSSLQLQQKVESKRKSVEAPARPTRKRDDSKENETEVPSPFEGRVFPFATIQYADRVAEWETNPKDALKRPEYHDLPVEAQPEVVWKHATNVVDAFLGTAYCRQYKWKDKDLAYIIQAEVEWQGKVYRGFFRYAFNEKGELYHRDFGIKSNFQMVDAICNSKQFGEEDFPTLQQAHQDYLAKGKPVSVVKLGTVPYKMNALGIVEVEDPKYGLKIRLFKHGKI